MNRLRQYNFIVVFFILIVFFYTSKAQPPKLVVIVVLDQFPYDYISRFQPYFSDGGFNYLLKNGASFSNCQYPYAYTKTGCGHAAIATGTTPAVNGIVGNSWYDRDKGKKVNCVEDESVQTLGAVELGCSPRTLLVSTLGDALRKKSPRSKVIGISNKDRSAILMAGKLGMAYWTNDSVVVSSTYYLKKLPSWVTTFNRSGIFQKYFGRIWNELNPDIAKQICDDDDAPYEANPFGVGRAFPYKIVGRDSTQRIPSYYTQVNHSPFATEILLDFSRKVIEHESLGKRGVTDMICIGISATDEIGHDYGPNSHEVFDDALRTDRMLSEFFSYLNKKIGLKNCVLVLTSDHGVAPIPEYKRKVDPELATARITASEISTRANRMLNNTFGDPSRKWIASAIDAFLYLDEKVVLEKGIPIDSVRKVLRDSLTNNFPIDKAYTSDELLGELEKGCFCNRVKKSFYKPRAGDVMLLLKPFSIIDGNPDGTNHGMPYSYDAHVPLIFAGRVINKGEYYSDVSPLDIVPTLAKILGLTVSKECQGNVLREAVK